MKQDLIIEKIHEGTRIDSVLSLLLEDTSRNYISKIIEQGGLKVNGKEELSKKYKVKEGDSIELEIPEPEVLSIEAEDIPLDIVYEDEHLFVVNKHEGLLSYSKKPTDVTVITTLNRYLQLTHQHYTAHVVHRLDRDTS